MLIVTPEEGLFFYSPYFYGIPIDYGSVVLKGRGNIDGAVSTAPRCATAKRGLLGLENPYYMNPFTDVIRIDDNILSVTFSLAFTVDGHKYFVAITKANKTSFFSMSRKPDGSWTLTEPIDKWIIPLESQLSEMIKKRHTQEPI